MMSRGSMLLCLLLLSSHAAYADGPADNVPDNVRRIPALGIEVPADVRVELEKGLAALNHEIASLTSKADELAKKNDAASKIAAADIRELLPDVQIYYRAVRDALKYREFFDAKELPVAKTLLSEGLDRAKQLATGKAPWTTQTGLVPRGYVSKIDGSVQPYGLIVPESYTPTGATKHRLDFWFHGRGETLSEVNFLQQRRTQAGQFTPPDTFVLHPYGRYCNANKLAGEIDSLEALESVQRRYRIDENRIAVRGFSMGGAACWQFAVHYADRWFAAAPGAGFSETADFLKVFQSETLQPTWYEQKLWHMYDCTDYAINLFHCPTVAYSGEIDRQKQAADMMAASLTKEGIDMVHIIGPKTAHAYHPAARVEIDKHMNSIAEFGRDPLPRTIHFTTWTLKYNRMNWVTIDGMGEHWERARVDARIHRGDQALEMKTANVTDLTLSMPPGSTPFDITKPVVLTIDGQEVTAPRSASDRSWTCKLYRTGDKWTVGTRPVTGLRKEHDLQGPIDDAFMDAFVFVRPTSQARHPQVEKWVKSEMDRAIEHWRRQFRGDARVKDDTAISDDDIANMNLVLWGDPASNAVLKKIADKLPILWDEKQIAVGDKKFAADQHAPILIYPNPLNPNRYVVLNSSFTYRDYDYLNNARQVPKLPDWAIVDLRTPPNSRFAGKIATADFFGEQWELRKPRD